MSHAANSAARADTSQGGSRSAPAGNIVHTAPIMINCIIVWWTCLPCVPEQSLVNETLYKYVIDRSLLRF